MNSTMFEVGYLTLEDLKKCSTTLLAALHSNFDGYRLGHVRQKLTIDIIFQWQDALQLTKLDKLFSGFESGRLCLMPAQLCSDSKIYSATVCFKLLGLLLRETQVVEVEMAAQLKPRRDVRLPIGRSVDTLSKSKAVDKSDSELILGMIDFGFPFAHREYRLADGKTRVHAIWDQDRTPEFPANIGTLPNNFGYGRQVNRSQINRLLEASNYEDSIYRQACCPSMLSRVTHGAASISLLAGNNASPSLARLDASRVSKIRNTQPQIPADIVFVQLPYGLPLAPSAGAAEFALLDGISYIIACAGEQTKRIVISIGYGSYLGPHDGNTLFERAIASLKQSIKNSKVVDLEIVFAAGNGADKKIHAMSVAQPKHKQVVDWWVPPQNSSMTVADAWIFLERDQLIKFSITNPMGVSILFELPANCDIGWGSDSQKQCIAVAKRSVNQNRGRVQLWLQVQPTETTVLDFKPACAGRWQISIDTSLTIPAPEIHIYTAWGGRNPGFQLRAKQGRFLQSPLKADRTTLEVTGNGTLISTACNNTFWQVGGYELWGKRLRSKYSGTGLARDGSRADTSVSVGVDLLAPCEETPSLKGILCAGTRSAGYFRENGTSVSAPIFARKAAIDPAMTITRPPIFIGPLMRVAAKIADVRLPDLHEVRV